MRAISIFSLTDQILCENLNANLQILFICCSQWFFLKSVTKRYIFQLTKCEHKGISESIDSDDRNFSSVKPQQIFHFFLNWNVFFLECSKEDETYILDILALFKYMLRIKNKNI